MPYRGIELASGRIGSRPADSALAGLTRKEVARNLMSRRSNPIAISSSPQTDIDAGSVDTDAKWAMTLLSRETSVTFMTILDAARRNASCGPSRCTTSVLRFRMKLSKDYEGRSGRVPYKGSVVQPE